MFDCSIRVQRYTRSLNKLSGEYCSQDVTYVWIQAHKLASNCLEHILTDCVNTWHT